MALNHMYRIPSGRLCGHKRSSYRSTTGSDRAYNWPHAPPSWEAAALASMRKGLRWNSLHRWSQEVPGMNGAAKLAGWPGGQKLVGSFWGGEGPYGVARAAA